MKKWRPQPSLSVVPEAVLSVIVRCQHIVCALPAAGVRRLILVDEANLDSHGGFDIAVVGGERYPAWDLGELVGMPVPVVAWVLVDVPADGGNVPVALGTGPCLAVQPLVRGQPLPPAIFRDRRGAFPSAFSIDMTRTPIPDAAFGLWIEPAALFTAEELAAGAAAAAASPGAPAGAS